MMAIRVREVLWIDATPVSRSVRERANALVKAGGAVCFCCCSACSIYRAS